MLRQSLGPADDGRDLRGSLDRRFQSEELTTCTNFAFEIAKIEKATTDDLPRISFISGANPRSTG